MAYTHLRGSYSLCMVCGMRTRSDARIAGSVRADRVGAMSYITSNILRADDYSDVFTFYGLPDDGHARRQYRAVRHALDTVGTRYVVVTRDETTDYGTTVETVVLVRPTVPGLVRLLSETVTYRERYEASRYWSDGVDYWDARGPVTEEYCVDIHGISDTRLRVIEGVAGIRIA